MTRPFNPRLTGRTLEVLAFIETHQAERGFPATVRTIGADLGFSSTSSVHAHLRKLCHHGRVERRGLHYYAIPKAAPRPAQKDAKATLERFAADNPDALAPRPSARRHSPLCPCGICGRRFPRAHPMRAEWERLCPHLSRQRKQAGAK